MLDPSQISRLLAAAGHLSLAALAFTRGRGSPLALPLALLGVDLFAWNFSAFCYNFGWGDAFRVLDAITTPLSPPLLVWLVLGFVGKVRGLGSWLTVASAYFGLIAAASAAGLVVPSARSWIDSPSWPVLFLAGWLPLLLVVVVALVRHLVSSASPAEKSRTRIFLAAVAIGGALACFDLLRAAGLNMPRLASLGTLLSTGMVTLLAVRSHLFEREVSLSNTIYLAVMAVAVIALELLLLRVLGARLGPLLFGSLVLLGFSSLVVRELVTETVRHREQARHLAVLGRWSAQLAHDLRTPLATLLGAAEVLERETDPERVRHFLGLLRTQAKRATETLARYQRIGQLELTPSDESLAELAEAAAAPLLARMTPGVEVRLELANVPNAPLDRELVTNAIENLLRNAVEALSSGGTVWLRTRSETTRSREPRLVLEVEDDGPGVDPRWVEHAFDDFFTTKATGSGLGLPFVRRVALAHGGDAELESRAGRGTRVTLRFPVRA